MVGLCGTAVSATGVDLGEGEIRLDRRLFSDVIECFDEELIDEVTNAAVIGFAECYGLAVNLGSKGQLMLPFVDKTKELLAVFEQIQKLEGNAKLNALRIWTYIATNGVCQTSEEVVASYYDYDEEPGDCLNDCLCNDCMDVRDAGKCDQATSVVMNA